MSQRNRLTTNTGETDIASLISGDTIFSIPYFQRPYKWKSERLTQLNQDILKLVDLVDVHFLGAIIIHGRRANPSDPDVFDVIDGQQRITTLFLYICATVKVLSNQSYHAEAAALFLKYLVINRNTGALSNFKIHSCKDDRAQINQVYADLLSDERLKQELGGFVLKPLPKSGAENGALKKNYKLAIRFLAEEFTQGGVDRIRAIYGALLNQISVVQINVSDPTSGPKIFDSLNSRQEPMTIGDLIRNDIFSRVANELPSVIESIDTEHWQPFYKKFDQAAKNLFESYFFPYGLIKSPNLQKSEVYSSLRKDWDAGKHPEQIIQELAEYQDAFIDIDTGSNLYGHQRNFAKALQQLHETSLPASTYPFLMQLSVAVKSGVIAEEEGISILSLVESFLVRRATCGHEPTGLHAVFKRLWVDCDGELTADRVALEIAKHKTVTWPSDEDFFEALRERPLYGVSITPFLVLEYDKSQRGDPTGIKPWLEHVLPDNPESSWFDVFSREQHLACKDRLANLLPLSSQMNRAVSNKPYSDKRPVFEQDSSFKSTRQFAGRYEVWTPEELERRAHELAQWGVSRWPHVKPVAPQLRAA